ncbi:MAG TPA: hypothetical protein VH500_05190 [Nitrososphaeraceae archaeon]
MSEKLLLLIRQLGQSKIRRYIIDIELTAKNHLDSASISVRNQLKQFGLMHKLELKFLDKVSVHFDDGSINLVLIIRTVTKDMMSDK